MNFDGDKKILEKRFDAVGRSASGEMPRKIAVKIALVGIAKPFREPIPSEQFTQPKFDEINARRVRFELLEKVLEKIIVIVGRFAEKLQESFQKQTLIVAPEARWQMIVKIIEIIHQTTVSEIF